MKFASTKAPVRIVLNKTEQGDLQFNTSCTINEIRKMDIPFPYTQFTPTLGKKKEEEIITISDIPKKVGHHVVMNVQVTFHDTELNVVSGGSKIKKGVIIEDDSGAGKMDVWEEVFVQMASKQAHQIMQLRFPRYQFLPLNHASRKKLNQQTAISVMQFDNNIRKYRGTEVVWRKKLTHLP